MNLKPISAGILTLSALLVLVPHEGFAASAQGPSLISVAHRGASAHAPENTLPSFRKAVELGANFLEMDLQQTSDEEIVIMHDARVDRTTDGKGKVRDLTLSQIKKLDAGSWFSPAYRGEKVPTLREVLNLFLSFSPEVKQKTRLVLELKAGNEVYPGIEERTTTLVRNAGLEGFVIYKSFHPTALKKIRKLAPQVPQIYVFLAAFPCLDFSLDPLPHFLNPFEVQAEYLQPKAQFLTHDFVKAAHAEGYKVIAWDVQSGKLATKMKAFGVDAIETDDPLLVRH